VAVFLTEVFDVGAASFEDPQSEQAEQGDQREVVRVVRQPRGGDQGFELQVAQSEGRRLGGYWWSVDVVCRRVRQDLVDHADSVEADHDRQSARDRRGLVVANVLQPAQVPLDVRADGGQRIEIVIGAPAQEHP
jgi:hypothetical protein